MSSPYWISLIIILIIKLINKWVYPTGEIFKFGGGGGITFASFQTRIWNAKVKTGFTKRKVTLRQDTICQDLCVSHRILEWAWEGKSNEIEKF